jgi:DNA-nicking Smr family endonuclease
MSFSKGPTGLNLFSTHQGNGWNIVTPSIADYVNGLATGKHLIPLDAQFTNLRHAIRNEHEIGEIATALGESNINKLITYPLHRLALFETVALIETEIRMQKETDVMEITQDIYRNNVKPQLKKMREWQKEHLKSARKLATDALQNESKNDAPYKALADLIQKRILQRYESGAYKPHMHIQVYDIHSDIIEDARLAVNEVIIWAVTDRIYQEIAHKEVVNIIENIIAARIDDKESGFPRLSQHAGNERHTFMLSGPPASGKGTAAVIHEECAKELLDIPWDDIVKINTDIHRHIVSNHTITGEEKEHSTSLNGDESSYITLRAYARMSAKITANRAPHLLMDGANPAIDRLNLATQNAGTLYLLVVTTSVEMSMERAYTRGVATGRYVLTDYMLRMHQNISKDIFTRLAEYKGQNIEFAIINTDVPEDEPPVKLMDGNLRNGVVYVFDTRGMAEFCGKRNLNLKAKNTDELFDHDKHKMSNAYIAELKKAGIHVMDYENKIELESRTRLPSPQNKK